MGGMSSYEIVNTAADSRTLRTRKAQAGAVKRTLQVGQIRIAPKASRLLAPYVYKSLEKLFAAEAAKGRCEVWLKEDGVRVYRVHPPGPMLTSVVDDIDPPSIESPNSDSETQNEGATPEGVGAETGEPEAAPTTEPAADISPSEARQAELADMGKNDLRELATALGIVWEKGDVKAWLIGEILAAEARAD